MRTSNDLAVLHFTKFVTDAQITVETTKCLHSFLANMVCLLEQVAQSSISISRVSQQTNILFLHLHDFDITKLHIKPGVTTTGLCPFSE